MNHDWEDYACGDQGNYEDFIFDPTVILSCDNTHEYEKNVKYLDTFEDPFGRDVLKFECPKCTKVHLSNIYN